MSWVTSLLAASGLIVSVSLAGPAVANAATTGASTAAATTTSLRSSETASRYDSCVTFRPRSAPRAAGSPSPIPATGRSWAPHPCETSGSPDRWSFGGGNLVTPPIVDGGVVYEGSRSGRVYGVSAPSGHQVWSAKAGSVIAVSDEQNADVRIGMAVGGGLLVVPAGAVLCAFGG
jgi:outer membrane protein assembly factor BamB